MARTSPAPACRAWESPPVSRRRPSLDARHGAIHNARHLRRRRTVDDAGELIYRSTLELYRGLEQALGASVATALMDRLPQEPVQELVTKTDLAATADDLKRDLVELRQELKGGHRRPP